MDPLHQTTEQQLALSDTETAYTLDTLLGACVDQQASDLYLTQGCPPSLRIEDKIIPYGSDPLTDWDIQSVLEKLLSEEQFVTFKSQLELNTSFHWQNRSRFRVNVYRQQQHDALVIRRIHTNIPTLDALGLPEAYKKLIMMRRGMILVAGQTGCGKSTSLSAMVGHRNVHGNGHIITIEDPVEFIHEHRNCIVSHRDIGIDTKSFDEALKNALRQHPDVILIGEIRDRETMEHAINFSETGHLCVATLHANNASQTIERILNFFPEEKHQQILMNLSLNLRGIFSQRLVANTGDSRTLVTEIMLNEGAISQLIQENKVKEIRDIMEKNTDRGMRTFDQSLLELYHAGKITADVAMAECDNEAFIRLALTQKEAVEKISQSRFTPTEGTGKIGVATKPTDSTF